MRIWLLLGLARISLLHQMLSGYLQRIHWLDVVQLLRLLRRRHELPRRQFQLLRLQSRQVRRRGRVRFLLELPRGHVPRRRGHRGLAAQLRGEVSPLRGGEELVRGELDVQLLRGGDLRADGGLDGVLYLRQGVLRGYCRVHLLHCLRNGKVPAVIGDYRGPQRRN